MNNVVSQKKQLERRHKDSILNIFNQGMSLISPLATVFFCISFISLNILITDIFLVVLFTGVTFLFSSIFFRNNFHFNHFDIKEDPNLLISSLSQRTKENFRATIKLLELNNGNICEVEKKLISDIKKILNNPDKYFLKDYNDQMYKVKDYLEGNHIKRVEIKDHYDVSHK